MTKPKLRGAVAPAGYQDNDGIFRLESYSIIDHCYFCGARDLDKPGRTEGGEVCLHPTRVGGPLRLKRSSVPLKEIDDE